MKRDNQLRETGSLLYRAGKHSKRKVYDENVQRIREVFQRSPRKSMRQTSMQLDVPPITVSSALRKRLRLRVYKLQLHLMIYQQDGAPPHFADIVRTFLDEQFPARWIGRGSPYITWHVRSPDLTLSDFFSCGGLLTKSTGYQYVIWQTCKNEFMLLPTYGMNIKTSTGAPQVRIIVRIIIVIVLAFLLFYYFYYY